MFSDVCKIKCTRRGYKVNNRGIKQCIRLNTYGLIFSVSGGLFQVRSLISSPQMMQEQPPPTASRRFFRFRTGTPTKEKTRRSGSCLERRCSGLFALTSGHDTDQTKAQQSDGTGFGHGGWRGRKRHRELRTLREGGTTQIDHQLTSRKSEVTHIQASEPGLPHKTCRAKRRRQVRKVKNRRREGAVVKAERCEQTIRKINIEIGCAREVPDLKLNTISYCCSR